MWYIYLFINCMIVCFIHFHHLISLILVCVRHFLQHAIVVLASPFARRTRQAPSSPNGRASTACRFQDWRCVYLRKIDFLFKKFAGWFDTAISAETNNAFKLRKCLNAKAITCYTADFHGLRLIDMYSGWTFVAGSTFKLLRQLATLPHIA